MKTILHFVKINLLLLLLSFTINGRAANYFWIGGAGNWSDLSHWATTSGGSTLHSFVPSVSDDVIFDINSGFTAVSKIVTVNTTATCRNMNWAGATNTPTITNSGSGFLEIYGSLTLQPLMAYVVSSTVFRSPTLGQTITTNGITINGYFTFQSAGGWILQDNLTLTGSINFEDGNFNTNNVTINVSTFVEAYTGGTPTRTLTLGSSEININNAATPSYKYTGNTLNAGTSHIKFNGTSSAWPYLQFENFFGKTGHKYYRITYTNPTNQGTNFNLGNATMTIRTLKFIGSARVSGSCIYDSLIFSGGQKYDLLAGRTQTIVASLTATTNLCNGVTEISSSDLTTQTTITFSTGATANVNGAVIQKLNITGSIGTLNAINSFDLGGNTNILFTTPASRNLFWVGGLGNWNDPAHWSLASGGAGGACIPTPVDNVFFNGPSFTAGSNTVTLSQINQFCNDMNWTGATTTPALKGIAERYLNVFGSITLNPSMTYSVQDTYMKTTSPSRSITTNGTIIRGDYIFNGPGGWVLQDNFNSLQNIFFNQGHVNTNGKQVDVFNVEEKFSVFLNSTSSRTLSLGASIINVANYFYYRNLGFTTLLNAGTSTINVTSNFNNTAGFESYGTGLVYNDVVFTNPSSINMLLTRFSGGTGVTFNNLRFNGAATINYSHTINNLFLAPNRKYIFDVVTYNILGTLTATTAACSGNGEISSRLGGSQATFSFNPSATACNISNSIIKDIKVVGSLAPVTATTSIDLGNNIGIVFPASLGSTLYWIGGSGNWTDGSHWSFTSGGPPAFCVPTPIIDVVFDGGSAFTALSNTVTLNSSGHYCRNMTWSVTIANNPMITATVGNPLSIFGSLVLQPVMRFNTYGVYFKSDVAGQTITSNGNIMAAISGYPYPGFYFDGGGSWTLNDNLNLNREIWLLRGHLNTNNKNIVISTLRDHFLPSSSGLPSASSRTLSIGTSSITVTNYFWYHRGTNAYLNSTPTSQVIFPTAGAYFYSQTGHTYGRALFTGTTGATYIQPYPSASTSSNIFRFLSFFNSANIYGSNMTDTLIFSAGNTYKLNAAVTQTVNNIMYASGNPCFITFIQSLTPASQASLNVRAGNVNYDFVNIRDINATPSYTTLNAAGHSSNAGNNTNWSFAPTTTVALSGLGPDMTMCASALPVTLNTTAFYPNPFTQFLWTGGSTASTLAVNSGGTYSVNVNYGAGCTLVDNITITANPTPTISVSGSTSICKGVTTTITASGAVTYTWVSPATTSNSIVVTPSVTTVYTLSGSSALPCVSSPYMFTITVSPSPTITLGSISANTICAGNSSIITPAGATNYTLMPGAITGTSFTVSPLITTTYTISGSNVSGCSSTSNLIRTITVSPSPTIGLTSASSSTICNGGSSIITPNGASTYTLMPGSLTGTSFTVSPISTTIYTVSGTNATGCVSTSAANATLTINVGSTPTVALGSVSSNTICKGSTSIITPTGASTYTLMPGSIAGTSFTVSPLATTIYTISGTGAFGCVSSPTSNLTVTITVRATPTIGLGSVSSNTICLGNNSVITPSGATSYTLIPGSMIGTSFTVSPTATTVYTISGTNSFGCVSSSTTNLTTTITVRASPTIALGSISSSTICSGNSSVIAPSGASSYTLIPGGLTGSSFTVSPIATTVYTISGTNSFGCISSGSGNLTTTITVNTSPTIALGTISSNTICNGNSSIITPSGAATYTINPGASSGTSFTVNPISTTIYTISGTSSLGCISTSASNLTATITVISNPTISLSSVSPSTICIGGTSVITPSGASNYTLSPGSLTGTSFSVSPAATTTYTISGENVSGCISSSNVVTTIYVNASPTIGIASISSSVICNGNNSVLTPSGAVNYTLMPGGITGTSFTVAPSASTQYTINGSDAIGCSNLPGSYVLVDIAVTNMTLNVVGTTSVLCANASTGSASITVLGGTPAYTFNWLPAGGTSSVGINLSQAIYTVSVSDVNLCTNSTTVQILGVSTPLNVFIKDTIRPDCGNFVNGTVEIGVTGGTPSYTYLWNNGVTSAINNNITSGSYTVVVSDANNCTVQFDYQLDCFTELFIPEIFSPNGDNLNDKFEIKGIYNFPNNKLTIYNRWGAMVFQKEKYNNDWDGKSNVNTGTGKEQLPAGTYYVLFDFGDGIKKIYTGYVQVEY